VAAVSSFVEFRAFRGTRRSSVYRRHAIPRQSLERIVEAARAGGLPVLGGLDPAKQHELGKRDARRLAEEASQLRASAVLLELDSDLTAAAEVANWCARAGERSWLRIQRQM
jgi:hypothetical protein